MDTLCGLIGDAALRVQDDEITRAELADLGRRLTDARDGITTFIDQSTANQVYWVERTGKTESNLGLHAAPIDLSEILGQMLFREDRSVVMTSATLSVGSSEMGYFRNRVGAHGPGIDAVQIGSPFDYEQQMKLYLTPTMPESPRAPGYEDALAKWIEHFVGESQGRAFVLFTNYRLMAAMAQRTRDFFERNGWPLLVQGEGISRRKMLETFKAEIGSVLYGTESFWSGVDVPGEALSNVIITQLPFAPPDSPATEARCELIKRTRRRPFQRIFAARGDPQITAGRGPADPHQGRQRHRRDPRQPVGEETVRAGVSKRAAPVPGGEGFLSEPTGYLGSAGGAVTWISSATSGSVPAPM